MLEYSVLLGVLFEPQEPPASLSRQPFVLTIDLILQLEAVRLETHLSTQCPFILNWHGFSGQESLRYLLTCTYV